MWLLLLLLLLPLQASLQSLERQVFPRKLHPATQKVVRTAMCCLRHANISELDRSHHFRQDRFPMSCDLCLIGARIGLGAYRECLRCCRISRTRKCQMFANLGDERETLDIDALSCFSLSIARNYTMEVAIYPGYLLSCIAEVATALGARQGFHPGRDGFCGIVLAGSGPGHKLLV